MVATAQKTKWVYKGEPVDAKCGPQCRGQLRVKEQAQVEGTERGVAVACEKCGIESQVLARFCKLHDAPEDPNVAAKATAVVPWVAGAMAVPKEQIEAVMPAYTALWGDSVSIAVRTLCARVAIAYALDPLAGEIVILGGKPYITVKGQIRNAERNRDYQGFVPEWVIDPNVRKAMGLKDGDLAIEATGYRQGRKDCKAWGIVRLTEIAGGGTNPVARSHPQEMCYERAVGRLLRHMYAMPLPGVGDHPETEADYYRQRRVDPETGEISPVIEGEIINTTGCTADQRKAIHALLNEVGVSDEDYHAELTRLYGVPTSMKLTASQASEYIDALNARLRRHEKGSPLTVEAVDDAAAQSEGQEVMF